VKEPEKAYPLSVTPLPFSFADVEPCGKAGFGSLFAF
jgi:hypothetical protein